MKSILILSLGVALIFWGCGHEGNKVIPDAEKSAGGGMGAGGLPAAESESSTLSSELSASPEFNLAKALQTQEEGFKKRDFKKAASSCEALKSEKLLPQLVSNMACRCFAVKLAAIIDSAASQKTQQTLCGQTSLAKELLDKKGRDILPCENELKLSRPAQGEETLNKMVLNLFRRNTDPDSLKTHFADLSQRLKEIFPISDKIFTGTPQCKFPKQFFATPKDLVLKEGDIHYVLGYLKTAAAVLQMASQYEFNLNPKKIVKEVIGSDGKRRKAIPAFLVADAADEGGMAAASPYDDDFILPPNVMPLMEIAETLDDKPFLNLPGNAHFLELKPLITFALENWVASASKPKNVFDGMSESAAKEWEKLKNTLNNSWAAFDETSPQRILVNLHQLLEHPPHFGSLKAGNFEDYPNFENLRTIPKNFLRLGLAEKKIREKLMCVDRNGEEREVENCEPASCNAKCEPRGIFTSVPVAEMNKVAVFAALQSGLRFNFEPQFNPEQIPGKVCNNGSEFHLEVTDLEKDEVALAVPRAAQLPAGIAISVTRNNDIPAFRIVVQDGTEKNKYRIFLGASDGKGPALVNRTMPPQGTFEKAPEVVQEIELVVDECPPELL